jgi:NAD+ kinase
MTFTRLGLVAKRASPALDVLADAARWFVDRGVIPIVDEEAMAAGGFGREWASASREALVRQVDAVIVFGGDGTLLEAARSVAHADADVPLLGVNLGRLGFLTEVARSEMTSAFETLLAGGTTTETRVMLQGDVKRRGRVAASRLALNDIVVTRGALSRMIELTVEIDGQAVNEVKADGLIVATPTGSTAYNLSAGGPIVHPAVDAFVLTPIAPHTLTHRPLVLPATATIALRPRIDALSDIVVTFDGQFGEPLEAGDVVMVRRAPKPLRLLRTSPRTHFDMLRQKLQWGR